MWLSCINWFYGLLGQEKPWCFIFSSKLRYEKDFFERISRILNFFVMFWRSNRNVVIGSGLALCVSYTHRIWVISLQKLWWMLMLSLLMNKLSIKNSIQHLSVTLYQWPLLSLSILCPSTFHISTFSYLARMILWRMEFKF